MQFSNKRYYMSFHLFIYPSIIMFMNNLQGGFVFVMRTYIRDQVINFPLGMHVSSNLTIGRLYLQSEDYGFGWRKIELKKILNGFKEKTCSNGTNGDYRLIKTGLNYAALELVSLFDESGLTIIGDCIFFIDQKTIPTDGKSQLPKDGASPNAPAAHGVDYFGDVIFGSGNNLGNPSQFEKFGDQIKKNRKRSDLSGGEWDMNL
jgi:hypothetical protein